MPCFKRISKDSLFHNFNKLHFCFLAYVSLMPVISGSLNEQPVTLPPKVSLMPFYYYFFSHANFPQ